MRRRVALVTPWYGPQANGGAESLARELARRLSERCDVTILTTCSQAFLADWSTDFFPAGTSRDGELTIRRFRLAPRSSERFDAVNRLLLDLPVNRWRTLRTGAETTAAFIDESINSDELEAHLRSEALECYDAVLFVPYLYGLIVRGIEAYPGRAHLLPCLHDEAYARLPRIHDAFHRAATILANSPGEAELALRLYGPGMLHKLHVIGSGVDLETRLVCEPLPAGIEPPYVLYVGRRDVTKNVDAMIAAFRRFRTGANGIGSALSLVLAGPGDRSYDDREAGVVDLGFVSRELKDTLLEHSLGLLVPSTNESYSRVLMEAWLRRKPVAVHGACLATTTAVNDAGGGFVAQTEDEWVDVLRTFAGTDSAALAARGAAGEIFARDNADWERVLTRLQTALGFDADWPPPPRARGRIDQFVQTLEFGDAISTYAIAIARRLRELGFDSTIYAEGIGELVAGHATVFVPGALAAADALIYHHSIAATATAAIASAPLRKALIYHNITPAVFFRPYAPGFADLLDVGRSQTAALVGRFDVYVADSDFNAAELRAMGAKDVVTIPVALDFSRFDVIPDRAVFDRSERFEVLFVGRISPSKNIGQLLDVFEAYVCFDPQAHLTLVGRYDEADPYYQSLVERIDERRLNRAVTFAGTIGEAQLLAYFEQADLYLSLSEHEGFCVPLVEAMFFDVPVIALGTTAVPETMGSAGLLVTPDADCFEIAALIRAVATDDDLRSRILAAQRSRRAYFWPDAIERRIDALAETLMAR